jgi:hypothetical protein
MPYGKTWPAHPKPFPDELLSSWIVRVAQANGIRLQPLSWMLFSNAQSPWNRDIDRSAPPWLIKALSHYTGTNYWDVFHTTLVTYRTRLYPQRRTVGQLRWVLTVRHYGMRYRAFGQQFCPACLATDPVAYFRKQWRLALFTYCPVHQVALHDACPSCGAPVVHYRGDFGKELEDALPMYVCHACGFDLREAELKPAYFPSDELHQIFDAMLGSLCRPVAEAGQFSLGFFAVMHQFCRIMGTRQNQGKLLRYLLEQVGGPEVTTQPTGRVTIEERRREERHLWLLCALWLMVDLDIRLGDAWRAKAVRYNLMVKDFQCLPTWYTGIVMKFSKWRNPF